MSAKQRPTPRLKDGCPYDAANRAARCLSCAASTSMAPCVVAWLRMQTDTPSNVIPMRSPERWAA